MARPNRSMNEASETKTARNTLSGPTRAMRQKYALQQAQDDGPYDDRDDSDPRACTAADQELRLMGDNINIIGKMLEELECHMNDTLRPVLSPVPLRGSGNDDCCEKEANMAASPVVTQLRAYNGLLQAMRSKVTVLHQILDNVDV